MKVIYKKSIAEKIVEAKAEANRLCKKVKRIELTKSEYDELMAVMRMKYGVAVPLFSRPPINYCGMEVVCNHLHEDE